MSIDSSGKSYNLEELQIEFGLSIRAINACKRDGLRDLSQILSYFKINKTFVGLRNIGRKTDQELTLLCQLYESKSLVENELQKTLPSFPILKPLTQTQIIVIDFFIQQRLVQLSSRAKTVLTTLGKGKVSFVFIYRNFIEGKIKIEINLPNLGAKTEQELVSFVKDTFDKYELVLALDDELLLLDAFKGWLFFEFKVEESEFSHFAQHFLEKRFPLFGFIDFLIRNGKVLPERNTVIFKRRSGYFSGIAIETLENLAKIFNLTRERVRQIAESAIKKFDDKIARLEDQKRLLRSVTNYSWDYEGDLLYTHQSYVNTLKRTEEVNFHPAFFTRILRMLTEDSYLLLECDKKPDHSTFLVKMELAEVFDFKAFLEDVSTLLEDSLQKEYILSFNGYLISFLENEKFDLLPRISQVCQTILIQEFSEHLSFDFQGNLILYRNNSIKVADYATEILRAKNRPMNIFEIHESVKNKHPDYNGGLENLRSHLYRGKDVFIFFGRRSTYGLREWEGSIEGIKGGTIRSIVEEYLEQCDEPKHISEILSFVLRFRPNTNERSVIGNLKLEQNSKFKDFGGNFWGLSVQDYGSRQVEFKKIPPAFTRLVSILLRKKGRILFHQIVEHFCQSLGLKDVQVDYQLRKLIQEGKLSMSDDGIVNL